MCLLPGLCDSMLDVLKGILRGGLCIYVRSGLQSSNITAVGGVRRSREGIQRLSRASACGREAACDDFLKWVPSTLPPGPLKSSSHRAGAGIDGVLGTRRRR